MKNILIPVVIAAFVGALASQIAGYVLKKKRKKRNNLILMWVKREKVAV